MGYRGVFPPVRPRITARALLAALSLSAACSGGGPAGLTPDPVPGPGDYRRSFVSDGFDRFYELHVPTGWSPGVRLPVVLVFHGSPGTPAAMRTATGIDALADAHGFLAVYPQAGGPGDWSTGCEACSSLATLLRIDDVRFVRELLARLDADVGIDRTRVTAAGFSNGALMVHRLACDAPDAIHAFVSVAATMLDPAFVPPCAPSRSVSIAFVHGTADNTFPAQGRVFGTLPESPRTLSIGETVQSWASRNGCTSLQVTDLPDVNGDGVVVRWHDHTLCSGGSQVAFYEVFGAGHVWPRTPDFSATDAVLAFAGLSQAGAAAVGDGP